ANEDSASYHASYIQRWNDRLVDIAEVVPETDPDHIRATTIYIQWYWTITRRWISTLVQRPPLAYQPRGHVERVLRSHYTIKRVLSDITGGGVLDALSHVADQMEAVLETLPTLSHTVPPRSVDYGGASTYGHAPVYSPSRPSSPIEEPPYADVMDPAPAPVPQDPPRAVDIPSSSDPPRPDILPTPATAVIEPVIEGAAIEHLDQLEMLEPFDEYGVDRGRERGRRRG
ncbi:hypothetical protein ACMD2_06737, partial [Ananas comosus]